jgi:hypothetical protein
VFLRRSIFVLFLVNFLLSNASASAGDYTVAYAFDAGDLNDASKRVDCEYRAPCEITSEKLNLSISLIFWRSDHKKVTISVSANRASRSGCCYFSDGVSTVERNPRDSLVRLHVFEGRARIRNEFILNTLLGVLYLQFSDMK